MRARERHPQPRSQDAATDQDSGAAAALRAEHAQLTERVTELEASLAAAQEGAAAGKLQAGRERDATVSAREQLAAKLEAAPDQAAAAAELRAANERLSEHVKDLKAELAAASRAAAAPAAPPASPKSPKTMAGLFGRSLSRNSPNAAQQKQQQGELEASIRALEAKNAAVAAQAASAEAARAHLERTKAALEAEKRHLAGIVVALETRLAESAPARPEQVTPVKGVLHGGGADEGSQDIASRMDDGTAAGDKSSAGENRDSLKSQLSAAMAHADSLRAAKAAADMALRKANEKLAAAAAEGGQKERALRAELAAAEARAEETGAAARKLRAQLEAAEEQRDTARVALAAVQAQLQHLLQEQQSARRAGAKDSREQELQQARAELAAAQAARAELQTQHDAAVAARRGADAQAAMLGEQLAAAEAERARMQQAATEEAAALRSEVASLRARHVAAPAATPAPDQAVQQRAEPEQAPSPRRRNTIDQGARPRAAAGASPQGEPDRALRAQLAELEAKLRATEGERASLARCLDRFQSLSSAHASPEGPAKEQSSPEASQLQRKGAKGPGEERRKDVAAPGAKSGGPQAALGTVQREEMQLRTEAAEPQHAELARQLDAAQRACAEAVAAREALEKVPAPETSAWQLAQPPAWL